MGNTLRFSGKLDIKRVYDLKGSRVKRYVHTKDPLTTTTLKDMNFIENQQFVQEINLSKH